MKKKLLSLCAFVITAISMTACDVDDVKREIDKIYPHSGDMYLKCDQIPGTSNSYLAPKTVEIESYDFNFNVVEGKGIGEFTLCSHSGKHTPSILDLRLRNATISKMEFSYYKYLAGKGERIYYVEFRNSKFADYNIECGLETYTFYSERVYVISRNINLDNTVGEPSEMVYDCTK